MNSEDARQIVTLAEEYLPIVERLVPIIRKAGRDIKPIMDDLANYSVELNTKMFNKYREEGFSRRESMMLIINTKESLRMATQINKK